MPLSLRDKLRAVDAPRKAAAPRQETPPPQDCWHRCTSFPLPAHAADMPMEMVRLMEPSALPEGLTPQEILYLDTETTGLSGGAGTVAFLVGVGYQTDSEFLVHQYLMRDYPEERFLLENLLAVASQFPVLCTFNGKSFDLPLLFSRLRMNRLPVAALEKPHVDLLHLARRIWKLRLGRCNLGRLEEAVLGEGRTGDIPGSQVPERFFAYLKTGDFQLLEGVLTHNGQDIHSLCRLLAHMAQMYRAPEAQPHEQDLYAMGVALEKNRHLAQARRCYQLAARGKTRTTSQLRLAQSYRRSGERTQEEAVWLEMIRQGEGWITPYEALAKYYEHQCRDLDAALEMTRRALVLAAEPSFRAPETVQNAQNALQYRYARLQRKREKQSPLFIPSKDRRD